MRWSEETRARSSSVMVHSILDESFLRAHSRHVHSKTPTPNGEICLSAPHSSIDARLRQKYSSKESKLSKKNMIINLLLYNVIC